MNYAAQRFCERLSLSGTAHQVAVDIRRYEDDRDALSGENLRNRR